MADLSDVETALATAAVAALFPLGSAEPSVTGQRIRIYRGWPLSGPLSTDLAVGIVNVSVFAVPAATRNTTRWAPVSYTTPALPTLTALVNGNSVTFDGAGGPGQLAGVLVSNNAFVYRCQDGDTPALIAAILAEQIRSLRACWLSGPTLSVPGVTAIIARVAADANVVTEWARQEQAFRVSAWCPDPGTRDVICSALGSYLSACTFLQLADGTGGRVRYRSTASFDDGQDAQVYRRDLVYEIEYATCAAMPTPSMLFGDLLLASADTYV